MWLAHMFVQIRAFSARFGRTFRTSLAPEFGALPSDPPVDPLRVPHRRVDVGPKSCPSDDGSSDDHCVLTHHHARTHTLEGGSRACALHITCIRTMRKHVLLQESFLRAGRWQPTRHRPGRHRHSSQDSCGHGRDTGCVSAGTNRDTIPDTMGDTAGTQAGTLTAPRPGCWQIKSTGPAPKILQDDARNTPRSMSGVTLTRPPKSAPTWSTLAQMRPSLTKSGQSWPDVGRSLPTFALVERRRDMGGIGERWVRAWV